MQIFITEKQIEEIKNQSKFNALIEAVKLVEDEIMIHEHIECWNYTAKKIESKLKWMIEETAIDGVEDVIII